MKFKIGNDFHYGWARLVVDTNAKWMVLKDYAYNSKPNTAILAGEGILSGVSQSQDNSSIEIFPNPASSKLLLSGFNGNFSGAEILVLDLSGRKIFSEKISSSQNEIDVSSLPNGIYLLELKNENE